MKLLLPPNFQCPVCAEPLVLQHKTYRCAQNHCYDQAKAGYVNLLLSQQKKSKQPGDSPEMVKARQDFLNAGYYQPMLEAVAMQLGDLHTPQRPALADAELEMAEPMHLLDMGCGDGYYLDSLVRTAPVQALPLSLSGVDVSKTAVTLAAKRKLPAQWAVASVYQLPFADQSFDLALSIFSPLDPQEVQRVLKPGGHLIMVGPGPDHLSGLMAHIYDDVRPHQGNPVLEEAVQQGAFQHLTHQDLKYEMTVTGPDIFNLLTMTPYYWKCDEATQQAFREMQQLRTLAHFAVDCYLRTE